MAAFHCREQDLKNTLDGVYLMTSKRPFSTLQKYCDRSFCSQPVFSFVLCLDFSCYSFPPFFDTESLSLELSITLGAATPPDNILPNLISSTLRRHARGRSHGYFQGRRRAREQSYQEAQRHLFPTHLRSGVGTVNRSPPDRSFPDLGPPLLLQSLFLQLSSIYSTLFRRRHQTDLDMFL